MQMMLSNGVATEIPRSGAGRPVIQNLGPGNVYLNSDVTVSTTGQNAGIKMLPGDIYEFASASGSETGVWVLADADATDLRVVIMGDR